jgi:hypothetical protein
VQGYWSVELKETFVLPFSRGEFFAVFEIYNSAIWPAQLAAYILGAAALLLLLRSNTATGRMISLILGIMWLWTGIFYHWIEFSRINEMAYVFGSVFVTQGASFIVYGTIQGRIKFTFRNDLAGWTGFAFIAYSMVLYPFIGRLAGESWMQIPEFGTAPCPVTIFTFGMLLFATPLFSRWMLAIPFAWSIIGGSAAFLLNIPQDWVLLAGGLVAFALSFSRTQRRAQEA